MNYEEMIENKGLLNFLKNVSKDQNSVKKFFSCSSLRSMYQYALENSGEKFSFDEFKNALRLLFKHANEIKKISECDEKAIVGGGKGESSIMSLMIMAVPLVNIAISGYQYFNICRELDEEIKNNKKLMEYYKSEKKSKEETLKKETALLESELKKNNK